ncbi:MAG: group III truncated hemoglobin [Flavobacterium sp.]
MKTDIKNNNDIKLLVDTFYERIKVDARIGFLFTEVAMVNWETHLPKMYSFWENIIFHTGDYNGNPMLKHKELHGHFPLNEAHFIRWMVLFSETVDSLFAGPTATEIKQRAENISAAMMYKTLNN